MRFLSGHSSPIIFAAAIAILLLMPTFLVLDPARAAPAQAQQVAQTSSPLLPPSSTLNPLSSFRNVGPVNPQTSVLVSVAIPLRNLAELTSFVKESSDPSSSNYRHYLNLSQASQMFLPTPSQCQSVLQYLTSSGFTIELSELNSMFVVRGTAAMVNQYLGQNVQLFSNGTYSYYETTGATKLSGAYSFGSNSTGLFVRPDYVKSTSVASGGTPDQNVTFTEGGQAATLLRTVYNTTGLLARGIDGKGYTVGILDFYGNPLISSDLATFDQDFGIPAPPNFSISPIGPYDPNLGEPLGWDGEIDLDVQVSHAMAPDANIVLYAGNGELPLSTAVAAIIQQGQANVVSQSFGIPEWEFYEIGPLSYLFNTVFADDYYLLGSSLGMTFTTSSGDAGGSGYSAGPEGGVEYPGSSPYVTALGGTATYISDNSAGQITYNQTAWSNIGFVPYLVNEGGGGGGVSVMEPNPWYQSGLAIPASFPNGRLVPDLSLDSSGTPGVYVIYQGAPAAFGGTSEASPLFAGLLTLIMGETHTALGLVNPTLYQLGANSKTYTEAYRPITFGYTIPWVSKFGYNLATGWGAPNIGEMASLFNSITSSSSLNVQVSVSNPTKQNFTDFFPGDQISVAAKVTSPSGLVVTNGDFTADLETLGGTTTPVSLSYSPNSKSWIGTITVGNESGVTYVNVAGKSGSLGGQGFAETFLGFLAAYVQPFAPYPWSFLPGLEVAIYISDLFGATPPFNSTGISFNSYSILSNRYTEEATAFLNYSSVSQYYIGDLEGNFTDGPMTLDTTGPVVGYLPFQSGIGLAGTSIYPQVVAEPGSVAPGQSLAIVASVTGPENIDLTQSLSTGESIGASISEGSTVTATLVSPSGVKVETVSLPETPCAQALRVCGASVTNINGNLPIPANLTSGLYTVLLGAAYNDETTGYNYGGEYFGQVYVAPGYSTPAISIGPTVLFEGQNATISASITYPNGKEVTHGVYTALVYPQTSDAQYSTLEHQSYEAFNLIELSYSPKLGLWTANATMPSPYNSNLVASTNGNAEYYGGPYDVYVSGISADGVPTASDLTAQQSFFVQPYVYTTNTVMDQFPQTERLALQNVTLNAGSSPLVLYDDYFIGNNTVSGTDVTISSSTIDGTLNIDGGRTTLNGVTGGSVVATASDVVLQHTVLSSLDLRTSSTASVDSASSEEALTPALPSVLISSPIANESYAGMLNATVGIKGSDVATLNFYLDGKLLPSPQNGLPPGSQASYLLNTTTMPDGTHTLTVEAVQFDRLTSSSSVSFVTDNQLRGLNGDLTTASQTISSLNGNLETANGNIATLQGNLNTANRTITDLSYVAYLAVALAAIGLIVAAYALKGGRAAWKY